MKRPRHRAIVNGGGHGLWLEILPPDARGEGRLSRGV